MIKTAIFDMDGLLINSEPFWQESEINIFKKHNLCLDYEMCSQTMGLRVDEVVNYWYNFQPWENPDHKKTENEILDKVEELIQEKGIALEGVFETLDLLKGKNFKIGLASSSHLRLINVVVEQLKIRNYFEVVYSAEFEPYGKPHPGVYITTAKKLGAEPFNCIAFEDSLNGLIAAKAAKMKVVAVPDPQLSNPAKFCLADIKLNSLKDFNEDRLNELIH